MFKQLSISIAAVALLASCSVVKEDRQQCLVPVNVHVNNFSISQSDFPDTKATPVADHDGLKAITLAFYASDGTEAYKHTQIKSDNATYSSFGEFSTSLDMDSYTMVVLGYGYFEGDVLTLSSPTSAAYTSDHVRETFASTQAVNISTNTAVNLSATLDRIVTKLMVVSSDLRTANAASVRMTFSAGGKSFNPTTGLATVNTGFANTVQGSGTTGSSVTSTSYLFLATDEQAIDVTIETLDALGDTLFSTIVGDVPLKRNRVTTLTGSMFTNDGISASSFQVNSDWIDPVNGTF